MPTAEATTAFSRVAVALRGGKPESWHLGAASIEAPGRGTVFSIGEPRVSTFMRSAAKPFQVLPLVVAGGIEEFGLEAGDLALMCGSHAGTESHVERARVLLERGGFGIDDLLCGPHEPFDPEAGARLRDAGEEPSPLHNNCSGKHAGMLLACRLLGLSTSDYLDPTHPLQQRILEIVARVCDVGEEVIGMGVDGCSAPTFHLPVSAMARGYLALAAPGLVELEEETAAALGTVGTAMAESSPMVAGPGRFTTRLIEATGGRLLGKEGAEGVYAVAVKGPSALGVALKIADGGERCRDGVVLDILRASGALAEAELAELEDFRVFARSNHRGHRVGEIVPEIRLVERLS